jgi:subtilisin
MKPLTRRNSVVCILWDASLWFTHIGSAARTWGGVMTGNVVGQSSISIARIAVIVAITCAVLVATDTASAASRDYVVVLRDGVSVDTHLKANRIAPMRVYRSALNGYAARLSDTQYRKLLASSDVTAVAPDRVIATAPPFTISPPPAEQPAQAPGNAVRRIGVLSSPTAKVDGIDDEFDVDIAILDTGIDLDHPDLDVRGGVACTNADSFADDNSHGTVVGGFAAAVDNTIGRVGVAPGARLWAVKVINKTGGGKLSNVLCGVDWVTANAATIEVANMSLNFVKQPESPNCGLAARKNDVDVLHVAICESVAAGVTYTVSAGNDSTDSQTVIPSMYDEVITVSAITDLDGQPGGLQPPTGACSSELNAVHIIADDTFVFFSNFGEDVDIAAPGVCINSTAPDDNYLTGSGTSFASPLAAGAAALYIANNPAASPADVRAALLTRAEPGPIPGDPDSYPEGIVNVAGL